MSSHKNPLQILQSLTQKKFVEPRKDKNLFSTESYPFNKEKSSAFINEIYSSKKNTLTENLKNSFMDSHVGLSSPLDNRSRSPNRPKRPTSKGNPFYLEKLQASFGDRPQVGLKSGLKDPISVVNGDFLSGEKQISDLDAGAEIMQKLELAFQDYHQEYYDAALLHLKKAEEIVERTLANQVRLAFKPIFLLFYNMTPTQYRLRTLGDCQASLNNCILNSQIIKEQNALEKVPLISVTNLQDQSNYLKYVATQDFHRRLRCKMHLQACLIYSEIENHVEAYAHAKQATKLACHLMVDTLIICYHLYLKNKSANNVANQKDGSPSNKWQTYSENSKILFVNENSSQVEQQQNELGDTDKKSEDDFMSINQNKYLESIIPILESIVVRVKGTKYFYSKLDSKNDSTKKKLLFSLRKQLENHEFPNIDMENLYGSLTEDHFLYNKNIMGVAQIQPLDPSQFNDNWTVNDATKRDSIIEQMLLLVVSIYALSTELRFWDDNIKREAPGASSLSLELVKEYLPLSFLRRESQLWVGRSLEFAFVFLPHYCPIAEQIFSIYSKLYNPTKFMIPEDDEVDHLVKYLIPSKGIVRSNFFFIPLIKKGEDDEDDGIATLLFTEKELENSLSNAIKQIKLFDIRSKLYDLLVRNYSTSNQRSNSKDVSIVLQNQNTKIHSANKFTNKDQTIKTTHMRKTFMSKSPLQREEKPIASGTEYFSTDNSERSIILKESSGYVTKIQATPKRNSESPKQYPIRPSSKVGAADIETKSPFRKLKEKAEHIVLESKKKALTDESTLKEGNSKSFIESMNISKVFFRPPSPGFGASSHADVNKRVEPIDSKMNNSSITSSLNQKEMTSLGNDKSISPIKGEPINKIKKDPPTFLVRDIIDNSKSDQLAQKKWARVSPDGKLRVLHRRMHEDITKIYLNHSDAPKVEHREHDSLSKGSLENSTSGLISETNEKSNYKDRSIIVKRNNYTDRSPVRALTSIKTRIKRDLKIHQTEGDEDETQSTELEINNYRPLKTEYMTESLELMKVLKKRSSSNEKRVNKAFIVTIKKGKKEL